MPPAPKHPDRRQGRHRADIGVLPPPQTDVPKPPTGLLKATRVWWDEVWRHDIAGAWVESDRSVVERLATLRDERERAYCGYRKSRLVEGSQGQPVINPLAKVMQSLDTEIRQLEDRLGLSPMARLKLGATFGAAHKSLDEMNREFDADTDDDEEDDPRIGALDVG